jgi:hypothetical protein
LPLRVITAYVRRGGWEGEGKERARGRGRIKEIVLATRFAEIENSKTGTHLNACDGASFLIAVLPGRSEAKSGRCDHFARTKCDLGGIYKLFFFC